MPPTDSPDSGAFSGTGSPGRGADDVSNTGSLPTRDADLSARDLDPDFASGGTAVDMSRSYGDVSASDRGMSWEEGASQSSSPGNYSSRGLGEQAADLKGQATETVRQTYDQVRQFTNEALDKARRQWGDSRGQFAERAKGMFRDQKDRLAGGLDGAVEAAHAVARSLEEQQGAAVAPYARMAAQSLEQVRDYLQAADVNDVADDFRRFTRRHPEWVLGGMFLAGIALSRFLKADRNFAPRGRPPQGADESLYGDIYRSQFDSGTGYGSSGEAYGDFDEGGTRYGGSSSAGGGGYLTGDYGSPTYRSGSDAGSAGDVAGYNPSGSDSGPSSRTGDMGGGMSEAMAVDDDLGEELGADLDEDLDGPGTAGGSDFDDIKGGAR